MFKMEMRRLVRTKQVANVLVLNDIISWLTWHLCFPLVSRVQMLLFDAALQIECLLSEFLECVIPTIGTLLLPSSFKVGSSVASRSHSA